LDRDHKGDDPTLFGDTSTFPDADDLLDNVDLFVVVAGFIRGRTRRSCRDSEFAFRPGSRAFSGCRRDGAAALELAPTETIPRPATRTRTTIAEMPAKIAPPMRRSLFFTE
jgi:hypothetical protein